MRIKVPRVERTWIALEWLPAYSMLPCTHGHMGKRLLRALELSSDELMDVGLRTKYAQDFDLNVDLDALDVDNVAPPTVKLNVMHQCYAVSNYRNLYILVLMKLLVFKSS